VGRERGKRLGGFRWLGRRAGADAEEPGTGWPGSGRGAARAHSAGGRREGGGAAVGPTGQGGRGGDGGARRLGR
jgi:hypothetical protein